MSTIKQMFIKDTSISLMEKGFSRKSARLMARIAITQQEDNVKSQFAGNRLRKERKLVSKQLGVPFFPTYNGPVYKTEWSKVDGKWSKELVKVSG